MDCQVRQSAKKDQCCLRLSRRRKENGDCAACDVCTSDRPAETEALRMKGWWRGRARVLPLLPERKEEVANVACHDFANDNWPNDVRSGKIEALIRRSGWCGSSQLLGQLRPCPGCKFCDDKPLIRPTEDSESRMKGSWRLQQGRSLGCPPSSLPLWKQGQKHWIVLITIFWRGYQVRKEDKLKPKFIAKDILWLKRKWWLAFIAICCLWWKTRTGFSVKI